MEGQGGVTASRRLPPCPLTITQLLDNAAPECAFANMSPLDNQAESLENAADCVLNGDLLLNQLLTQGHPPGVSWLAWLRTITGLINSPPHPYQLG
jgi:hypothetical protein